MKFTFVSTLKDFEEAIQELQDDIMRAAERASRNGLSDAAIARKLHTIADQAVRPNPVDPAGILNPREA